jgi:hypothetical protein
MREDRSSAPLYLTLMMQPSSVFLSSLRLRIPVKVPSHLPLLRRPTYNNLSDDLIVHRLVEAVIIIEPFHKSISPLMSNITSDLQLLELILLFAALWVLYLMVTGP